MAAPTHPPLFLFRDGTFASTNARPPSPAAIDAPHPPKSHLQLHPALAYRISQLLLSQQSRGRRHLFLAERAAFRVPRTTSTLPEVHSVGVVGAGTMGAGIAIAFLFAGFRVTLIDAKQVSKPAGLCVRRRRRRFRRRMLPTFFAGVFMGVFAGVFAVVSAGISTRLAVSCQDLKKNVSGTFNFHLGWCIFYGAWQIDEAVVFLFYFYPPDEAVVCTAASVTT